VEDLTPGDPVGKEASLQKALRQITRHTDQKEDTEEHMVGTQKRYARSWLSKANSKVALRIADKIQNREKLAKKVSWNKEQQAKLTAKVQWLKGQDAIVQEHIADHEKDQKHIQGLMKSERIVNEGVLASQLKHLRRLESKMAITKEKIEVLKAGGNGGGDGMGEGEGTGSSGSSGYSGDSFETGDVVPSVVPSDVPSVVPSSGYTMSATD